MEIQPVPIGLSDLFASGHWLNPRPGEPGPFYLLVAVALLGTLIVHLVGRPRGVYGQLVGPVRWATMGVVVLAALGVGLVGLRFLGVPYLSARILIYLDLLLLAGLATYLTLMNPVAVKELRSRMRGWRAFATLTFYLAVLGGFAWLLLQVVIAQQTWNMGPQAAFVGKSIMIGIATIELFLVCFIAPAFTAGSIAGEKERQTFDLLAATPLAPRAIVLGKLFAALVYVLLLVITAIPLQSLSFMLGGVAPDELVVVSVLLLLTAVTFGTVGIFFSSLLRSSSTATVLSYVVILLLVFGSPLATSFASAATQQPSPAWIMYPNPFYALTSAVGTTGGGFYLPFPFSGFLSVGPPMPARAVAKEVMVGPGAVVAEPLIEAAPTFWARLFLDLPPWEYYIIIYVGLSLLLLGISFVLVRPPALLLRRPRWVRREVR